MIHILQLSSHCLRIQPLHPHRASGQPPLVVFQKDPAVAGCACVCVWNFWTEVNPLLLLLFQPWHGPTKTHPSCCAYLQLLNRDGMWLTQEPPCRFSTRITSEFELGTWTDEGDFWFIFLRRWCNLRLRWTSCPFHFFAYIVGFFVASFDFIFSSRWRRRNFPSTPHQTLLSGVKNEVKFLHDRCIPHQNLIRQVWASVCVCVCVCACIANININIYIYIEREVSLTSSDLTLLSMTLSSRPRLRANLDSVQAEWPARKMEELLRFVCFFLGSDLPANNLLYGQN